MAAIRTFGLRASENVLDLTCYISPVMSNDIKIGN